MRSIGGIEFFSLGNCMLSRSERNGHFTTHYSSLFVGYPILFPDGPFLCATVSKVTFLARSAHTVCRQTGEASKPAHVLRPCGESGWIVRICAATTLGCIVWKGPRARVCGPPAGVTVIFPCTGALGTPSQKNKKGALGTANPKRQWRTKRGAAPTLPPAALWVPP